MIKDQCDKCRVKDTCLENKVFDSTSCSNYVRPLDLEKHKIDLEKHDSKEDVITPSSSNMLSSQQSENGTSENNSFTITREYLKQNTSIHGWLSFFLFTIITGGLFSAIYPIATYNPAEYDGSTILALTDVFFGILLCLVAFLTLYSFCQRKPDAVFLGKTYVIAVFVSNLLSLFGGDFAASGLGSLPQVIRGLVWGIIWFSYLCVSNQVKEIIPKDYRKLSSIDYYVLIALIVTPLLCLSVGLKNVMSSQQEQTAAFINETVLSEGEYTDGKVVFSIPNGFTCRKQEVENLVVYNIEDDNTGTVTLCSDYDSDQSVSNINSYWQNWEDNDAKQYSSKLITNEKRTINGRTYFYKVKKYDIEGSIVFWRFSMLFDDASSKVCVMSCYDNGVDYYFEEIIKSIRFH